MKQRLKLFDPSQQVVCELKIFQEALIPSPRMWTIIYKFPFQQEKCFPCRKLSKKENNLPNFAGFIFSKIITKLFCMILIKLDCKGEDSVPKLINSLFWNSLCKQMDFVTQFYHLVTYSNAISVTKKFKLISLLNTEILTVL